MTEAKTSRWTKSLLHGIFAQRDRDRAHGLTLRTRYGAEALRIPYADMPGIIAAHVDHLRAQGIERGTRILMPFETDARIIFAFLALLAIGAIPFSVKPSPGGTQRASYIAMLTRISERHGVELLLDTPGTKDVELPLRRIPLFSHAEDARSQPNVDLDIAPDDIAFVQFTSGSTSVPKGIPVSHDKLVTQLEILAQTCGMNASTQGSSWLPLFHDMGLIAGLLSCIHSGSPLDLGTPMAFLLSPLGWLEHMSETRAHSTIVPNFAIEYCVRALRDADASELETIRLDALKSIFLGSEPINIDVMLEFTELLAPRGLDVRAVKPAYGMAEAVLMVTGTRQDEHYRILSPSGSARHISVGKPHPSFEIRIRNEDGSFCKDGDSGEIEIRGGTLVSAYLEHEHPLLDAEGFYHTGDIGFVESGELFILGRTGERFKINAQSYFAADVEHALLRLPIARPGYVAAIQTGSRILGLIEVVRNKDRAHLDEMRAQGVEYVFDSLGLKLAPEDIVFVANGQLTRTSSGKMQRRAITQAFEAETIRMYVPREN